MKVKDWVNFLQSDKMTEVIGLQLEGGLYCRHSFYLKKEEVENSFYAAYLNEEVIKVYYNNFPHGTLLVFKDSEKEN